MKRSLPQREKSYTHAALLLLIFIMLFQPNKAFSQNGIQGKVSSSDNNPLPVATIFVEETNTGTITNGQGKYKIELQPGTYTIKFQHLSFQTIKKKITITKGYKELNIKLKPRPIQLNTVTVSTGEEDPAYDIIRHSIAAATYYRMVIKSYDVKAYIKSFMAMEIPGYVQKFSEIDDTTGYYVKETILKARYDAPNKYNTHVIATQNNDNDTNDIQGHFVIRTIYHKTFMGAVSPLSPKALRYYRYRLENTFCEGEHVIHKIKVIPKAKSRHTFHGHIYIVEGDWGVHSLFLKQHTFPGKVTIKQFFAPVEGGIWFPINHNYKAEGTIFGIDIGSDYLATLNDYQVELDKKVVFDIKEEIQKIDTTDYDFSLQDSTADTTASDYAKLDFSTLKGLSKSIKVVQKQLKEEKKQEKKKQKEPEPATSFDLTVDSLAMSQDSAYWEKIRPVPLSKEEKSVGLYTKLTGKDTSATDSAHKKSVVWRGIRESIFWGKSYSLPGRFSMRQGALISNLKYNTVEGFVMALPISVKYWNKNNFEIGTVTRYGFNSKRLYLKGKLQWTYNSLSWKENALSLSAGRFISQYNHEEAISPLLNSLYTLLVRQNHMKLYEKEFIRLEGSKQISPKLIFTGSAEYAHRSPLSNTTNYSFFDPACCEFTSNNPENHELKNTAFNTHSVFIFHSELEYKPRLQFVKNNGRLIPVRKSYPVIRISYRGATSALFNTDYDWQRVAAGIEHKKNGVFLSYGIKLNMGMTFNSSKLPFIDYKHFNANQTIFQPAKALQAFRLLDYYKYSSSGAWINVQSMISPNRFLLTQLPFIKFAGFEEYLNLNYLRTETSPNYWEAGYGIGYLTKAMSVEFVTSWEDLEYQSFGIRLRLYLGQ